MSKETKKIVCGLCASHCTYGVIVENGEFLGPDVEKKPGLSPMAEVQRQVTAACPRAHAAREFIYHRDRLNYPLKRLGERGGGRWERISWGQALDEIASKLEAVKGKYGAETMAIATSGEQNCADEYRVRFQNLFGSPNFLGPSCGTGMVLSHMMSGAVIFIPHPYLETRCVTFLGVNPARSVPGLWRGILEMRKYLGLKIIVIDPRDTTSAREADIWLRPRAGTDAALLLGMIRTIIDENLYDKEFVEKWCYGFDKLVQRVQDYPIEKVAAITGIPAEQIRETARIYARTKPGLIFHLTGVEEQPNSTRTLQARYILSGIAGNIDIKGGDVMMALHPTVRSVPEMDLHEMLSPEQQDKLIGADRFPMYSWRTFRMIEENARRLSDRPVNGIWLAGFAHAASTFRAMIHGNPYPVKALLTIAKNPLLTFPNSRLVWEALMNLDIHVAMDVFMTPTCRIADYVLPAACSFEKPFLHGVEIYPFIHGGEAAIEPLFERKPEYYLWRELGTRLGQQDYWQWKTIEEAYDWRLEPLRLTFKQFIAGDAHDAPPLPLKKYEAKGFGTPTGKYELYCTTLEKLGYDPLPSYMPTDTLAGSEQDLPLTLIGGGRNRNYYHSQGRQLESLRKRSVHPTAQISPETGTQLGIAEGDWIWIETRIGKAKFKCEYSKDMTPQAIQAEHGWWAPEDDSWESFFQSNVNAIIDDDPDTCCDPVSGGYLFRGQPCRAYKT
ncbi:MAG: dehydrogenase [Chloroflexi bacterium]|nr:dehydrogenase [Chloroflexota bacterium]